MVFLRHWLLVLFLLILGGGQIFAASSREERAFAAATAAFQTEMWSVAETQFADFKNRFPDSTNVPQAVLLRAQAQFKQGKLTETAALLSNTNNLEHAGGLAHQYVFWTAEAQFRATNLLAAAENYARVRTFTNSTFALAATVNEAAARTQLQQWPAVEQLLEATNGVFQNAAQLDAGSELVSRGRLFLAQSKFEQQNLTGAAEVLAALQSQPLPPELDWQRAHWLYRVDRAENNLEAALMETTNLLLIAKISKDARLQAGSVALHAETLEKLNRRAEAAAAWAENLANVPGSWQQQAVLKIAELALAQNQFTNAEAALEKFLADFPGAAALPVALLTLGELHLKDFFASGATNHLPMAQQRFDQFLAAFKNDPLAGKVFLDRGWVKWQQGNFSESLGDFQAAAVRLPASEDLVVAKLKTGDALMAQKDFAAARKSYQSVLDGPENFDGRKFLDGRALYQMVRASLELNDTAGANDALTRLLNEHSVDEFAQNSALLLGESLVDPGEARRVFENLQQKFPGSPLLPQARLAVARTFEQEQNWEAAITNYSAWLADFPTNGLRPQAHYARAWASFQSGDETNSLAQFKGFIAQFPADELAPPAQWWVADYYFRATNFSGAGNYLVAETNYENIFQNPAWKSSPLVYPAQLMAGRAAMGRLGFSDAVNHFTKLLGDTNMASNPAYFELGVQARFACAAAFMQMASPDTNNPLANFQAATNILGQLTNPTNATGARAWGELGKCDLQLNNFDAATNAFAQAFSSTNADIATRSQAQTGFGIALEKKAALLAGEEQKGLLKLAVENYWAVFKTGFGEDLRDGEAADPFWVKKAGLQMLPLLGLLETADQEKFIGQMEKFFPQLKDSLAKERLKLAAGKVEGQFQN